MALTAMMRQYLDIKEKNKESILFFRLGDFYEMFFEDAVLVSKLLDLTLTGKDCGLEERAPMCGIPYHSAEGYISRLIQAGYKVAICEQLEDPKNCKTLVKRGIIRIVTPGTIVEQSMLDEKNNNYLLALYVNGKKAGFAYTDISTGECELFESDASETIIKNELYRINPHEIIANDSAKEICDTLDYPVGCTLFDAHAFHHKDAVDQIKKHFGMQSLTTLGLVDLNCSVSAAGALLKYLEETQKNAMSHLISIRKYYPSEFMYLDATARRNLELTQSLHGGSTRGTLLGLLDYTKTSMGARLLRQWLEQPLATKEKIESRLNAVEALYKSPISLAELRDLLSEVKDIERIISKISFQSLTPRHCVSLCQSFSVIPDILRVLETVDCEPIRQLANDMDPLEDISSLITEMIDMDSTFNLADGGVIRAGYNGELDQLRLVSSNGKKLIAEMEQRERENTGIKALKIVYNKIFGYCIEVTRSYYELVPIRYLRRQTLSNCERYTTDELQDLEKQLVGASEKALRLEAQLFGFLQDQLGKNISRMQNTACSIKTIDALSSLAFCAREHNYVRPDITEDGTIDILNGRHPVVEHMIGNDEFVPNNAHLDMQDQRLLIVTGPNMAGKSTYMRQVALIAIMAHMGSFVPAEKASVCIIDQIFTRIGASDDVAGGRSTFMVEMEEISNILHNATEKSLLILDEVGRGTSTFDGLSIAWAILEYLCENKHAAKTLFSTHYHELTELEGHLPGVTNYRIAVKEYGEEIIFLRKIEKGGADKSFGIQVAKLAGLPKPVIARAQEILARVEVANEASGSIGASILQKNRKQKKQQLDITNFSAIDLVESIRNLDVNAMTPVEALNQLYLIREKARKI